ncbi:hypothetical protein C1645_746361, partial [Glomus cerebriforme]
SEYFNDIISGDDIEKQDGNFIIKIPNIVPQAFDAILKYIYIGNINITNNTETELLNIMIASDELKLKQLTKLAEDFIIKKYQFLQNNPVGILQLIYDQIILKRDDLNLTGIEIWENLIKWGLAQERKLDQDVSKWNQDDINTFKRILNKFIPLIRFYEITSEDYFNKVKPYEEILSKELRDDILKFYMIPEYRRTFHIDRQRHSTCDDINSIIKYM